LGKLSSGWVSIGTAFAYERQTTFLTAAHCVKEFAPDQLAILCGRETRLFPTRVDVHPKADAALLTLKADAAGIEQVVPTYRAFERGARTGTRFHAFGFPEDIVLPSSSEAHVAVPRIFMGHVQRLIARYKSRMGYEYSAAELSIPAPPGLSGGPFYMPQDPRVPYGLVADNLEVGALLFDKETLDEGGVRTVHHRERVIEYGIAVLLPPLVDWIDSLD
jgi:Trypsin-like peptidase domain